MYMYLPTLSLNSTKEPRDEVLTTDSSRISDFDEILQKH